MNGGDKREFYITSGILNSALIFDVVHNHDVLKECGIKFIADVESALPDHEVWKDLPDIKHDSTKTTLVFCLTHEDKLFEYNLYKSQPDSQSQRTYWIVTVGDTQYKFVSVNQNLDGLRATSYIMSKQLRAFGTAKQLETARKIGESASKFSK